MGTHHHVGFRKLWQNIGLLLNEKHGAALTPEGIWIGYLLLFVNICILYECVCLVDREWESQRPSRWGNPGSAPVTWQVMSDFTAYIAPDKIKLQDFIC